MKLSGTTPRPKPSTPTWARSSGAGLRRRATSTIGESSPATLSAAAANLGTGYVDGIPFKAGDVLAWDELEVEGSPYEKWVMFLDLSDLVPTGNVTNLAAGWRNSDTLLVGLAANLNLPGITGKVNPWEVVTFDPSQVGPNTSGTFQDFHLRALSWATR